MTRFGQGVVVTVALVLAVAACAGARADEARLKAYGRHLAGECTSCHRLDGVDNGIPGIVGMPFADFIETFGFYKTGARDNAAMQSVAQSLDDQQVKALGLYFSSLPPPPKRTPASQGAGKAPPAAKPK